MKLPWVGLAIGMVLLPSCIVAAQPPERVDIGSDRQLFVDDFLIAEQKGVRLVLHAPTRREVVLKAEHAWERLGLSYMVTFRDGEKFRAWYRCDTAPFDQAGSILTAYAESDDGSHWVKPKLGIIDFRGSKDNNLVWAGPGENMAPFKDANPAAPSEARYKAIVRSRDSQQIFALISPDGLHWKRRDDKPMLTEGPFDSHNIAFWDSRAGHYVVYTRGVRSEGKLGAGMSKDDSFFHTYKGVRWIRRSISRDFRHWGPLELIDAGDSPLEHLYTNAAVAYERSPGLYLLFPSRFADARKPQPDWKHGSGVNDIVFLASRDGLHFRRLFLEAYLRPGLGPGNWHERAMFLERGILQTAANELSLYATENWKLDSVHIRRLTLRPDGFVSAQASYEGGELVTRPIRFTGKRLRINASTSAVGSVEVELQDRDGKPIPGFARSDAILLCGDDLDWTVRWKAGDDVSRLAGQPIRLRFIMRDADMNAFRAE